MNIDKYKDLDKEISKEIMKEFKDKEIEHICPYCKGDPEFKEDCLDCGGEGKYKIKY